MSANKPKKFIVLETEKHVKQIKDYLEWLTSEFPESFWLPVNRSMVNKFIQTTVQFHTDARSAFKFNEHHLYELYVEIITGKDIGKFNKKTIKEIIELLESEQLSQMENDIEKEISNYIPMRTYVDWTVVQYGGIVGLIEGQDHRIEEWYKLTKQTGEQDEAILTLDYSNLVSYLHKVFNKLFWKNMSIDNIIYNFRMANPHITELQLTRAVVGLNELWNRPQNLIVSSICDTLITMYPMLEFSGVPITPRYTQDVYSYFGIGSIEAFQREYVAKVVSVFTLNHIGTKLDKCKKYYLETTIDTAVKKDEEGVWIMSIYEKEIGDTEAQDRELVQSLLNGDFLPEQLRRRAEQLYLDQQ